MKKLVFSLSLIFCSYIVSAQKINISESSIEVDKVTRTGLGAYVDLDKKTIAKSWEKHLKNYGKVESSKGVLIIQSAKIPTVSAQPARLVSEVKESKKGSFVWWALDIGTHYVTTSTDKTAYKAAEKLLYDFIYQAYMDDINEQVKNAEKALSSSEKAHEKEIKNGERLVSDVDKNRKEKAKLEQALIDNQKAHEQLLRDIEQNKKDQLAATEDVAKMKKAVEVVKAKANNVGN